MFDALRGADVPLNYVMNFYLAARIKQMWEPNKDRLSDKQSPKIFHHSLKFFSGTFVQ